MLNNIGQVERHNYSGHTFIGTVVFNNDPDRLGRVKVQIPNLMEGDPDVLPWIAPLRLGPVANVSSTEGSFGVPNIGAELFIEFQGGDPLYGFYVGSPVSVRTRVSDGDQNYPNAYGFRDQAGNVIKVDPTPGQNIITVNHASGTMITIYNDGTCNIIAASHLNLSSSANINLSAQGDLTLSAQGDVTVLGAQIHLNP